MLNERLKNIRDGELRDLLVELEQVKSMSLQGYEEMTLHSFLLKCQQDVITGKRDTIQAAKFYNGSLLKTKVGKLQEDGEVSGLVDELCSLFRVPRDPATSMTLYVFINNILNPKSKMRKPPPFRF